MSAHVYHGVWINWSHGPLAGTTLTLGEENGSLLIAFIAFFVTLIAAQLFKILSYVIHQLRSTDSTQDGLYHQQQIIFKNSVTPMGAAWSFLQQAWAWRSRAKTSFLRTLPWAIFCVSYMAAFGVAAVFSSQITKSAGSARLIISDDCGYFATEDASSAASVKAYSGRLANQTLASASYARECYGSTPNKLTCNRMMKPALETRTNVNASCPFAEGMCEWGDNAAFEIMSERIDSLYDLGINSRPSDRVHFQKVATCSPLTKYGFIETSLGGPSSGKGIVGDGLYSYMYGPSVYTGGEVNLTDYTYLYNNHSSMDSIGYKLSSASWTAGSDATVAGWKPIPELNRTDADIVIMFLSQNGIIYAEPVDDPMFSAHRPMGFGLVTDLTYYQADWFVNIMACVDQFQVCNPNTQQCSGLMGVQQIIPFIVYENDKLGLNLIQQAITTRLALHSLDSLISTTIFTQAEGGLAAQECLVNQMSQPLAINQWHIEVENFFNKGLAHIQLATIEYAAGPPKVPGSLIEQSWKKNGTLYAADYINQAMCESQMINDSSDSVSFSVLGMAILFAIGGFIILLSTILDTVVGWIQHRFGIGTHARMCWLLDDKLQLHRFLNQELGQGQWNNEYNSVPHTVAPHEFHTLAVAHQKNEGNPEKMQQVAWPTETSSDQTTPAAPTYHGIGYPGRGYVQVTTTEEHWHVK